MRKAMVVPVPMLLVLPVRVVLVGAVMVMVVMMERILTKGNPVNRIRRRARTGKGKKRTAQMERTLRRRRLEMLNQEVRRKNPDNAEKREVVKPLDSLPATRTNTRNRILWKRIP